MKAALFVLNPRQIPECLEAIRALPIDTCWLSYMTEAQAAREANIQIAGTDYDAYVVVADDTVPTPEALQLVLNELQPWNCTTGYCNLDTDRYRDIVNLTSNVLPPPPPAATSYQLMTRQQAEQTSDLIPTTFAGLALTAMPKHLWQKHPLQVSSHGGQMDYMLSYSLAQAGVPIFAPNGAYIHHVKERWNHMDQNPQKRLLVGHKAPAVTWDVKVTA